MVVQCRILAFDTRDHVLLYEKCLARYYRTFHVTQHNSAANDTGTRKIFTAFPILDLAPGDTPVHIVIVRSQAMLY